MLNILLNRFKYNTESKTRIRISIKFQQGRSEGKGESIGLDFGRQAWHGFMASIKWAVLIYHIVSKYLLLFALNVRVHLQMTCVSRVNPEWQRQSGRQGEWPAFVALTVSKFRQLLRAKDFLILSGISTCYDFFIRNVTVFYYYHIY